MSELPRRRRLASYLGRGAALFALAAVVSSGALTSRAEDDLRTIDLGDGVSVRQVRAICGVARCTLWVPIGFTFGANLELQLATTFARVPETGRIVAGRSNAPPWGPPLVAWNAGGLDYVLTTDDLGQSWRSSRWRWWTPPRAIAFDRRSSFGVAAGDGGHVWNTDDGGETWVERRAAAGQVWEAVWVVGRVAILRDAGGVTYVSRDGGFVLERVTEDPRARVEQDGEAFIIRTARSAFRVTRAGSSRLR